jgi:hypothetical protein
MSARFASCRTTAQLRLCLCFTLLSLGLSGLLSAQGLPAALTGIVSDPSGAVVPNANVVLTQTETGAVRRTVTNANGYFSIPALPAGVYDISVEAPGFTRHERKEMRFHAGDRLTLNDIVLKVAVAEQTVDVVAAEAVLVPTDTGEKSHVITTEQMQNLAVLGRSADELIKILPGVVYNDPDTAAGLTVQFNRGIGNYNVGGTRNTQVANNSDGQNVIDPGCNCGSAVTPNVDMLAEVKVQTSNFAAENAAGPVVFSAVSKSGTSKFHGEAYLYARHHTFNAQDWRNNRFDNPKPNDSYYFPGFNLGGPLTPKRNKLFFFAGVEYMHQNRYLGLVPAVVPTEAMRQGDFSNTNYLSLLNGYNVNTRPNNDAEGNNNWNGTDPIGPEMLSGGRVAPSAIDRAGQMLLNRLPLPNADPTTSGGYNYISALVNPEHRNQKLGRLDYNISDNTKLYTRFNHEYQQSPYPYTLWWGGASSGQNDVPWPGDLKGAYNTYSSATSLVNVINPTTTNEVVFGMTYWGMSHQVRNPESVSRQALGFPYKGIFKNNTTDIIPNFTDWGGGVANFIQPGGLDVPGVIGNKWILNIRDNFSKVLGTHTMKFGGFYEYVTNDEPTTANDNGQIEISNWGGNSTGNAYADLLMGRITSWGESTTNPTGNFRRHEFSFFAQDSWKVSRRFTMEFGSRFQHNGWMFEKNGYMFGFDARQYNPNSGISDYTGLLSPHLGSDIPLAIRRTPFLVIAPRFGFAFDLFGTGNTVIRGGVGVFKYNDRGGDAFAAMGNPPLRQSVYVGGGLRLSEVDARRAEVQKSNIEAFLPNEDKVPTTHNWSFTISQRMPFKTVLETSYVGNSSQHQMICTNCAGAQNINRVPEGAMFGLTRGTDPNNYRPFENYGTINLRSHALSQNYHSLQVTANRQTGKVGYSLAYTFAKAMGIGGDSFGTPTDAFDMRGRSYGPLGYDRTHTFSAAYNVHLPGSFRNPVAAGVLNGWQVSGISQWQSGAPVPMGRDAGNGFRFSGTVAGGEQFSPIAIVGTPDTQARPFLSCDPREGTAPGQRWNPTCFVAPTVGNNGVYRMPYMKLPPFQNHDLSLFKNFVFSEERRLQFRISGYNFVNHPLPFFNGGSDPGLGLNYVNGVLDQASLNNFGRTTMKRGRRLMQFAIKYYF